MNVTRGGPLEGIRSSETVSAARLCVILRHPLLLYTSSTSSPLSTHLSPQPAPPLQGRRADPQCRRSPRTHVSFGRIHRRTLGRSCRSCPSPCNTMRSDCRRARMSTRERRITRTRTTDTTRTRTTDTTRTRTADTTRTRTTDMDKNTGTELRTRCSPHLQLERQSHLQVHVVTRAGGTQVAEVLPEHCGVVDSFLGEQANIRSAVA